MVKELFIDNSYIKSFNAEIVNILKRDNKYLIELNQTAFYPEGGGQPSDTGNIGEAVIEYVFREDDKIYHQSSTNLSVGETYECCINWERRFDLMQQHTGQHLLSAALENLFDADTIGFHLSEHYTTIDINKKLDWHNLYEVEAEMNRILSDNKILKIRFPAPLEVDTLPLRKPPKVKDNIRIIEIDNYDYSPCGGTHTQSLSEIGIVKITNFENYKSGIRIEFLCGQRAFKDYQTKNDIVNQIARSLASKTDDIMVKFKQNQDSQNDMRKTIKALNAQLFEIELEKLKASPLKANNLTIYKKIFNGTNMGDIRKAAATLANEDNVVCIFGSKEEHKANLMLARSKNLDHLNMKTIFAECISTIDGKGGGNPQSAQGGGSKVDKLEEAILSAYNKIVQ